jgi:ankyrin repeat protein
LHHACYLGHLEIARVSVENGAKINKKISDLQLTPLHGAIMNGDPKLVAFLVEHGADIHAKDSEGATPLIAACWVGAVKTVKYLLSKGASIDIKTKGGATPLHCACQSGNLELVQFLINNGSEINSQPMTGATPLHMAVALGSLKIVKQLLISGADPKYRLTQNAKPSFSLKTPILKDNDIMWIDFSKGQSALDIAIERGYKEIITLLKNAEQQVHRAQRNPSRWEPIER